MRVNVCAISYIIEKIADARKVFFACYCFVILLVYLPCTLYLRHNFLFSFLSLKLVERVEWPSERLAASTSAAVAHSDVTV